MSVRFTDLQCKEVICVNDGRRLGFVRDIQLGIPGGEVLAILVPGPCRILGILGHRDDYLIPWRCIRRIGPEIVLVDVKIEECRVPRNKSNWLFS